MDNLVFSLNVVLPMFLVIAAGYLVRRLRIVDERFLSMANKLCFQVLMPIMLFNSIYSSDFDQLFDWKLIGFAVAAVLIVFLVLMLLIPRLVKSSRKRGVIIQGLFRSNFMLFGAQLARNLFGDDGIAPVSMLMVFVVPLFNVLAVIALETFREDEKGGKTQVLGIVKNVLLNPFIITSALAILLSALGVKLPVFLESGVGELSKAATPLAMMVLGGTFRFANVPVYKKETTFTVVGRLILMPAAVLSVAVALGFRGESLGALMVLFASPIAVSSYVMAKNSGGDDELAGHLIVFSTIFSAPTIFLFVYIFKSLGLI